MYIETVTCKHVRSRRAGHVYRKVQGTLLKEVGLVIPEGRRPPGRPRRRFKDNQYSKLRQTRK